MYLWCLVVLSFPPSTFVTFSYYRKCEFARQALYVWRNGEARSHNHFCRGKAVSIKYFECVSLALGIQRPMHMRHVVICGVPSSTIFFHLISLTSRLKKTLTEHKIVFWFSLQLFSLKIPHYKRYWAIYYYKSTWYSCKVPTILVDFNYTWIWLAVFWEILKYRILWKSIQWEPRYFSRQTDGHLWSS